MKKTLIITQIDYVNNSPETKIWRPAKMYKRNFEFIGPDNYFPIEDVKNTSFYKNPPKGFYKTYSLHCNVNDKDKLMANISTKNFIQDFKFNWQLGRWWFQKPEWKFIIPTTISIVALLLSIYNILYKK